MTIQDIIISTTITLLPLGYLIPETDLVCGDIGGAYVDGKVYVCQIDAFTEFYKQHEIAHHIWLNILSQEQKDPYTKEYKKAKKIGIRAFYRPYGYHDVEEDFSDNYSLLQIKENSNPYVMKRVRLIKKLLTP